MLECLLEHRKAIADLYAALFPALSDAFPAELPAHVCTWERFVWAAALIDTRAWATEVLAY